MAKPLDKLEPSLAQRVEQICAEAEAFIDAKAQELKDSSAGASQPIASLRHMLTARDRCACESVLRLSKL